MKKFDQFTTDELQDEINRRAKETKNNSNIHPLSAEFIKNIKEALKRFGSYSFLDKGPDEVMDISNIVNKLSNLDIKTIGTILTQCLDSKEVKLEFTASFVECIISSLDDRSDFDELFELDDRFEY